MTAELHKKILIIESDEENLKFYSTILKCSGYDPIEARNNAKGIEFAMAKKPNLILSGIRMPVIDGFDLLKAIKSDPFLKDIPLIALSANAPEEDDERLHELGFCDCIKKPIILKEFIRIIEQYLQKSS